MSTVTYIYGLTVCKSVY